MRVRESRVDVTASVHHGIEDAMEVVRSEREGVASYIGEGR
jgi:hypothetical protein